MDYDDTIRKLWGYQILDFDKIFSIHVWRLHLILYSPVSLVVYKQKTFFPSINQYVISHNWRKWYVKYHEDKYWKSFNIGLLYMFYVKPVARSN